MAQKNIDNTIEKAIDNIKKSSNFLKSKLQYTMDEEIKNCFTVIEESTKLLSDSIKNSNTKNRYSISNSQPRLKKAISLSQVFAIASHRKVPPSVIINLPENNDITLVGDFYKLVTVFSHLFENSVQAMDIKGTITVRVKESGDFVIVDVEDTGPGVPEEAKTNLFKKRLYTTKKSGTGIGLKSIKTILDNHGGSITFRNNPTTFTVKLPKYA